MPPPGEHWSTCRFPIVFEELTGFSLSSLVSEIERRDVITKIKRAASHLEKLPKPAEATIVDEIINREKLDRQRARQEWSRLKRNDGKCDKCSKVIEAPSGYLVAGPLMRIRDKIIDPGNYLVCEECYFRYDWWDAK
jgi:hypothetical protein